MKFYSDKLPQILFVAALCTISSGYGYFVHRNQLFPHALLRQAREGMSLILSYNNPEFKEYYVRTDYTTSVPTYDPRAAYSGLTLVTAVGKDDSLSVTVIDMDAVTIHAWNIDWFEIWPDAVHIPITDPKLPKSRPGTVLHGAVLLRNGDLVFNFEHLGIAKLDICGNVVWKLPYRTHHSIHQDENGDLWVSGEYDHVAPVSRFPNYIAPFIEPMVFRISVDGQMLDEISLLELLEDNDLQGLLFMSSIENKLTIVTGDTLHLNDVETFPGSMEMKGGRFDSRDVMVSLRNINAVLIFDRDNLRVKEVVIGEFVRQHDPDFVDANTISIFDNNNSNNIAPDFRRHHSRILLRSFVDDRLSVYYTGSESRPFFTGIMGKHEWLPNGNLLITEPIKGRAFEVDKEQRIGWEFVNLVDTGYAGIMQEAHRLSRDFTKAFFDEAVRRCAIS